MLASSVGRLALLAGEFQRVALSATARPIEAIADFVGGRELLRGPGGIAEYRKRQVGVVAPPSEKRIELAVEWPQSPEEGPSGKRRLGRGSPLRGHRARDSPQDCAWGGKRPGRDRVHRLEAPRGAHGLPDQRGAGRGIGMGPSRIALQGSAPARRGAIQIEGARMRSRHRLARARDRRRERRRGRPRGVASLGRLRAAADRTLRPWRGPVIARALSTPSTEWISCWPRPPRGESRNGR